ncbi:MAG: hypothetical protein ACR2O1_11580 [Boseongicola sp.]
MKMYVLLIAATLAALLAAGPASAACFADYKAKKDSPLRLHYGVMKLDVEPCRMSNDIASTVKNRLANGGWTLLQVQSVFDERRLEAKKKDAGAYFLRF